MDLKGDYAKVVLPLLQKYCLDCHSTKAKKGSLDLERFTTLDAIRKDIKPWQHAIEQLETGEMPPRGKPQPTDVERRRLLGWIQQFVETEAKARTGDPGKLPLRRLSNFEYDCTIRDLTGVDLKPAKEFPADGAGGEGFTNASESLSDITPPLLSRYLASAKEISEHTVLLPDGFRFSPSRTRRDWTDECTDKLRKFYASYADREGRVSLQPYLAATVKYREALREKKMSLAEVAAREKVNAKYLNEFWTILNDDAASYPLDTLRKRWQTATEKEVPWLVADINTFQSVLWKTYKVGSYMRPEGKGYAENLTRQMPQDPPALEAVPLRLALKPAPGQSEVVLYLATHELGSVQKGNVIWQRPRFEASGKPTLLLRDYGEFGPTFELDYRTLFANCALYLDAARVTAHDPGQKLDQVAAARGLDASLLRRWAELLALSPVGKEAEKRPSVPLDYLAEKAPVDPKRPAIRGWRKPKSDLPVLVTNSTDKAELIPGRVSPHGVAMHPMPREFVGVAWKSPVTGTIDINGRVAHAHPACGNGIAWWLEHRRAGLATVLGEGPIDLGKEAKLPGRTVQIEKGDLIVLAVDARDQNHFCDMTEVELTLQEKDGKARSWNLAADIADSVEAGNPHADRHGHAGVWHFVHGASKGSGTAKSAALIPHDSLLGQWRQAAADPKRHEEAGKLASQVQALLSGPRPAKTKGSNLTLYDKLVAVESPLWNGIDLSRLSKSDSKTGRFGLPKNRFGTTVKGMAIEANSLAAPVNGVTEIRLPAALFAGREFVVEGCLDQPAGERVVAFRVLTSSEPPTHWAGPVVAAKDSKSYQQLIRGSAEFRKVFPLFVCFPQVVPTDEVVSLKMFHREDEPLERLLLDDKAKRELDRLWQEHRFVSRQAVMENDYLPQFIGYVTQDQPKAMVAFFESMKPAFQKKADAFRKEEMAASPRQWDALMDFTSRAYRRPLQEKEKVELRTLHDKIRKKGADQAEAFRGVMARVLVSPSFLFRIERAPPGVEPRPVNDWELATRLSYFLWSAAPDEELRSLAAAGKLRDPKVLEAQARRMIHDERIRALAIEFGTQWIHVRGFEDLKEKNEKLFPSFDAKLRKDIYEEAILFFQDLFQQDRPFVRILDADYTYLNDNLAKHYGIPGVAGPKFRRVEDVRKHGRGGILAFASVHARQSGASRTSPVLRGNWVVETLLGEKLPRPPADVPVLPDVESTDKQTTRQMTEKHVSVPSCATCHVRIDPFGFAFEKYDPIGRLREKEPGGQPVDTKAKLRDGTEFDGIDGLRSYLLTQKKEVIERLFCRKLLGYALGRATTLSDTALIEEMATELRRNEGRISAAVLAILRSPQFRMIRGSDVED